MKNIRVQFLFIVICLILSSNSMLAQWVETNGPYGGYICSIDIFSNGNGGSILLAGNGSNGVILSTDNGNSWTQTNLKSYYVYSFASVPNNNGGTNIFAATTGPGIFLSTDYGNNWEMVNNNYWASPSLVSFTNSAGNIVLCAGEINGISLSYDYGKNWSLVDTTLKQAHIFVFHDENGSANLLAGTYGNGVFVSTDDGINWKQTELKDKYTLAFTTTPNGKGGVDIFAGNDYENGVWVSTDNGTNWVQTNLSTCVYSLTACDSNLFAGTSQGIFVSSDHGQNWVQINNGLTNLVIRSLVASPNEVGGINLFAGTYGDGIFLSTDNGLSWENSNKGILDTHPKALAIQDTNVFVGTLYGGVFKSTTIDINWMQTTLNQYSISSLATIGSTYLFAATYGGGVFRSTDNGLNWKQNKFSEFVWSLATSSEQIGKTEIFAGTRSDGVFFSSDNGTSWEYIGLKNNYINAMAIAGKNLFCGTYHDSSGYLRSNVFLSSDNGTNWTPINNGLDQNIYISSFAVLGKYIFAGSSGDGVFRTIDDGKNWIPCNSGLNDHAVHSLKSVGTNLFVGTNEGVYLSKNSGESWTHIGLTTAPIYALSVSNTYLYACDYNGCVWKRPISEMFSSIWQAEITVKDNGNVSQVLSFGQSPIATDSIDSQLSEVTLPPPPFGFDARFHLPGGDDSWKDFRSSDDDSLEWLLKFQPGSGGYPITFSWDKTKLPKGLIFLRDIITGTIVNVNMKTDSSYTLTNSGITALKVEFRPDLTPVELTAFEAVSIKNNVNLSWQTATEKNNARFEIERGNDGKIFEKVGVLDGNGTTLEVHKYNYTDVNSPLGKLYYRLKQVDFDGTANYSNVIEVENGIPTDFSLSQNYPNPFNPTTVISYALPVTCQVQMKVYNLLGQEVETLVNGMLLAGYHEITWNAANHASGIYICSIEANPTDARGNFHSVKKLILMK